MLRRLLQPVWVLLAVIFLIEAWLWDHLEPIVARVVALIPLDTFKQWLADRVDALSPAMTLIVFIVPVIPLFPLKLVGFCFQASLSPGSRVSSAAMPCQLKSVISGALAKRVSQSCSA